MLNLIKDLLEVTPTVSSVQFKLSNPETNFECWFWKWLNNFGILILFQGNRRPFVMETVKADDAAKLGMPFLTNFPEPQT